MGFDDISILFVEDEVHSQEITRYFLEHLHFKELYVASNGEEGLKLYKQHKPNIILTDLHMPVMDGLELSRHIKQITPDIPILLITSHFEKEVTEQAIDIGIDAYLFKPLSFERLERLLYKFAQRLLLENNFSNKMKLLQEYKRAIDVSAAVTKTDANGVITYVNDAFCKMSKYSRQELIGQKHSIIKHPDTPEETFQDIWQSILTKHVWQGRIKNLKKDGTPSFEHSVIVPIMDEDNEIVEYISIRQDITDIFHQEEYLRKRIQEEVNKNLQLHKKQEEDNLLQAKFTTIGKMAAGITHEINTPLTYIRGNLELMLQDLNSMDDSIPQKAYMLSDSKTILDGVHRIASIVESMREMASQTKEIPKATNIYASLITALTLSYNKAKQTSKILVQHEVFDIGMDKEKFCFEANVQVQRIEQVMVIIINNALDSLKKIEIFEERLLEIFIEEVDQCIVIRFKDNGAGISEAILPKIFDPFQSDKEEGGMGIGLNVAKRIVDDHGGQIIPSNHENGALFEVYLPKKDTPIVCSVE